MRRLIRAFDQRLSDVLGVFEFTQEPVCILRLQLSRLRHDLVLPDAKLTRGTPILEFHLWNERVPPMPPAGVDLAWARGISRRLIRSFQMIRTYLETELAPLRLPAIGGVSALGPASGASSDVLGHLGFHPWPYRNPLGRFGEFWENFYTWGLMWTFNPTSLRGKRLMQLHRTEYWMSTPAFLERFAAA